jgi:hypothetical protein
MRARLSAHDDRYGTDEEAEGKNEIQVMKERVFGHLHAQAPHRSALATSSTPASCHFIKIAQRRLNLLKLCSSRPQFPKSLHFAKMN